MELLLSILLSVMISQTWAAPEVANVDGEFRNDSAVGQSFSTINFNINTVCLRIDQSGEHKLEVAGYSSQIPVEGNLSLRELLGGRIGPEQIKQFPYNVLIDNDLVRVEGKAPFSALRYMVFAPFRTQIPTTLQAGARIRFFGYGEEKYQSLAFCKP